MNTHTSVILGGVLTAAVALAFSAGLVIAQSPSPTRPHATGSPDIHEQMHHMMDMMHGNGTSQRMHEAMGVDAERLMEQCAAMMTMMPGMASSQGNRSMPDMMDWMMR